MTLRIVLADDHPVVRAGLRVLIDTIEDLEVVGDAADGAAALRETLLLRPDVVLMDVRMEGVDGVEATRRIRAAAPETAVLMLTMYDDDATVFTAMQAGARGYLLKGATQEEIVNAVRAVAAGQAIFGPAVAARMLRFFAPPPASADSPFPTLTAREHDILDLLAAGRRIGEDPIVALRAIREALLLPYAALLVDGEGTVASGTRPNYTTTRSLPTDTGRALELEVGLRPGDLRLSPSDRQVLDIATPLLALSLRASALAADLQQSRQQTIAAREEERRRLRRDLHDGLGPRLTGIAFTADAAHNMTRRDPVAAERLLEGLRAETTAAIESIRELVYAMRPPALDELGLAAAVAQAAGSLRGRSGELLRVVMRLDGVGPLPAAVEVAAYRIAVEALTNVARHTDSDQATVVMAREGTRLAVEVTDGASGTDVWHPGVGLSSMRERAEDLGGSLAAGSTPAGGRVRAELPLGQSS